MFQSWQLSWAPLALAAMRSRASGHGGASPRPWGPPPKFVLSQLMLGGARRVCEPIFSR